MLINSDMVNEKPKFKWLRCAKPNIEEKTLLICKAHMRVSVRKEVIYSMNEITEQFFIFSKLMRRYIDYHLQKVGKYANFLRGQGRILAVLKIKADISQKELTHLLAIRPQSLGELLVKLEKKK